MARLAIAVPFPVSALSLYRAFPCTVSNRGQGKSKKQILFSSLLAFFVKQKSIVGHVAPSLVLQQMALKPISLTVDLLCAQRIAKRRLQVGKKITKHPHPPTHTRTLARPLLGCALVFQRTKKERRLDFQD